MPTYELRCDECDTRFEKFLGRLLREDDKVCPACGSKGVRVVPGAAFVPKPPQGSGGCSSRGGFS
jgi:putative FmdB family regulatory protein